MTVVKMLYHITIKRGLNKKKKKRRTLYTEKKRKNVQKEFTQDTRNRPLSGNEL